MNFPHGETVDVLTAGSVADPYSGEPSEWWDTPTEESHEGVAVEPRPSQEPVQDARNAVTSGFTLYGLPAGSVTPANRVRVRGKVYDVLGEPSHWVQPMTGTDFGLVVQVGLTEG
jgi:hypothetical protein